MTETLELRPPEMENLVNEEGKALSDEQTGRGHMSHSSIGVQLACLKKYELGYVENLELIARPRPLDMGSAFHKALELGDPIAGADALREATTVRSQEDEDRLRVEEAVVVAGATLYLAQWPDRPSREFDYRVRLRSPWTGAYSRTFDLLGTADGLEEAHDGLSLTEDKLVGQIDAPKVNRLVLDRQVSLACYALWRAKGKKVREVKYRFIRKPSIRQKQNESLEQFIERLTLDYGERPEFYSQEETLFRTDADLLTIEAELWDWAEQRRNARSRNFYARNTSACSDYGGCQFIPICCGQPDALSLYRQKENRDAV